MFINYNPLALNANNQLFKNTNAISKRLEKLSSGYRINRAADDAAGLAISEKMRYQINGLNQASRNIQDGISLIQTAEGAMQEIHAMLQRMNVLANQAANGTYSDGDREEIQLEIEQLREEINSIVDNTNFNGIKLLNGNSSIIGSAKSVDHNPPYNKLVTITSPLGNSVEEILNNLVNTFNAVKSGKIGDDDSKRVAEKFTLSFSNDELYLKCITGDSFTLGGGSPNLFFQDKKGDSYVYKFTQYVNENDFIVIGDIGGTFGGDELKFIFSRVQNNQRGLRIQIGDNADDFLNLDLPDISITKLEIAEIDVSNQTGALSAIKLIQNAINIVSAERARLGAYQNRLEYTLNNVQNYAENLSAAESRIRDADMAKEMMELTRNQILAEVGQAMLAQANAVPQNILRLLG